MEVLNANTGGCGGGAAPCLCFDINQHAVSPSICQGHFLHSPWVLLLQLQQPGSSCLLAELPTASAGAGSGTTLLLPPYPQPHPTLPILVPRAEPLDVFTNSQGIPSLTANPLQPRLHSTSAGVSPPEMHSSRLCGGLLGWAPNPSPLSSRPGREGRACCSLILCVVRAGRVLFQKLYSQLQVVGRRVASGFLTTGALVSEELGV